MLRKERDQLRGVNGAGCFLWGNSGHERPALADCSRAFFRPIGGGSGTPRAPACAARPAHLTLWVFRVRPAAFLRDADSGV
jgi:hypothetical protein